MQFAVPQFTDVEDKLIGPLTLKQFLMALGFAGIIFFFWSILGIGPIFFIISLPIAGFGAYVIFHKFNGRPFFSYLLPLISFLISPKLMVFSREPEVENYSTKEVKKEKKVVSNVDQESTESRLKKLSYLLDQKFEQEKEIIAESHSSQIQKTAIPQAKIIQAIKANQQKTEVLPTQELPPQFTTVQKPKPPMTSRPKPAAKKEGFDPDNILKRYS